MAFPDDALEDDEEVVFHLHPHVKTVVWPLLVLAMALAAVIVAWVMLPADDGGLIGVGVVAALSLYFVLTRSVRPLLVWRCTHYVITDERILLQDGVIARLRRDLPLNRINDHLMSQSLIDRLFGCGTLTIDSIGDRTAVLPAVPQVRLVQRALYHLIEAGGAADDDDEDREEDHDLPMGRG
ncbi:PH domain-containing protein [Mangrovihabitans endophyticus]|uniref:Membrane protein n=1 Tax=Mangrovihabitans endophyticus TaxID=1751298 RepID=A0A8J3C2L2_9ACTN|nr:PH domain-containing protein [Mangrovihabitans endophyticus]GGL08551.1 membrane protein [Mangrovihabitans endophyticus]